MQPKKLVEVPKDGMRGERHVVSRETFDAKGGTGEGQQAGFVALKVNMKSHGHEKPVTVN